MKKQILRNLLVIVGVVMLVGLIASCSDDPEPRFMVIESREYTAANSTDDENQYLAWQSQKNGGRQALDNPETYYAQYRTDANRMVNDELGKKNPAYGLLLVLKLDNYKLVGRVYWTNRQARDWSLRYRIYNN